MDDNTHLQNLLDAIERVMARAGGTERDVAGPETVTDIVTMADAAASLSPAFRRAHPSVPWLVLAEMARIVRRAGEDLDLHSLGLTVERDLPELHRRLQSP